MTLGYMAIDQYGHTLHLGPGSPRQSLLREIRRKSCQKMYVDTKSGETKHIGYIVGGQWFRVYEVHEWTGRSDA